MSAALRAQALHLLAVAAGGGAAWGAALLFAGLSGTSEAGFGLGALVGFLVYGAVLGAVLPVPSSAVFWTAGAALCIGAALLVLRATAAGWAGLAPVFWAAVAGLGAVGAIRVRSAAADGGP